jgi:branched-chain amino acid transport system substrate-binding protein
MKKLLTIASSIVLASSLQAKEINIGIVIPTTGAIAGYGQTTKTGIDLAHSMKHTLKNGDTIKLIYEDNSGDKAQTANVTKKLITKDKNSNDYVVAMIGALTSGNSLVVASIVKKAQIGTIAPVATNKKVTYANPYMNRACFIDPFQGKVAAKFALETLKEKKAIIIIDKSQAYSAGLAKEFKKAYESHGGKVVKFIKINSGDKDFKAAIQSTKETNTNFVYSPIYAPEMALFAKQTKTLGLNLKFLGGDGLSNPTLLEVAKDSAEGIMFSDHFNENAAPTNLSKEFVTKYHKKYNKSVPAFAANGADSYFVLFNAINKCEKITRECVAKNITKTRKLEGVTGYITIPESGNPKKSAVINVIKNQKVEYKATVNP